MKDALLKSWQTTMIGLIIIAYNIYHYLTTGQEIDFQSVGLILVSLGFIVSKDGNKSHTKSSISADDSVGGGGVNTGGGNG